MKYRNESLNILAKHMGTIEDKRGDQGKLHRLIDIFILSIYGLLCGHTDFTNMASELKYREEYFIRLLGLKYGVPSHDTFSAVFSLISPQEFLECFISWIVEVLHTKGKHVAIDGKAVRAALKKVHSKKIPYLVNAYVVDAGLCIGQIRIDEKTNEIKGIPEMLTWLDLEGATVSIDAIGCQKEIAALLIEKGADFVLQVKENQKTLHEDILLEMNTRIEEKRLRDEREKKRRERGFKQSAAFKEPLDVYQEQERGHSRIERRTYYALNDSACVDKEEWPHVESVGLVYRERIAITKNDDGEIITQEPPSLEYSVYIMSKEMSAEKFAVYARGHWGIENSLHWVLDDFFREDRCTARIENATENVALMRKIVYNLMKLDENVKGMSMKGKSVYYRNHFDAIQKLIFEDIPSKY